MSYEQIRIKRKLQIIFLQTWKYISNAHHFQLSGKRVMLQLQSVKCRTIQKILTNSYLMSSTLNLIRSDNEFNSRSLREFHVFSVEVGNFFRRTFINLWNFMTIVSLKLTLIEKLATSCQCKNYYWLAAGSLRDINYSIHDDKNFFSRCLSIEKTGEWEFVYKSLKCDPFFSSLFTSM